MECFINFYYVCNCRPETEISSTLLTTGDSITLSHLRDTTTFTNSVLSESRLSTTGSETVDVPFKIQEASQHMQRKKKSRQKQLVKSDTMSTTKETRESIVGANYEECNIQQILQQEIQNMAVSSFIVFILLVEERREF